MPRTYTIHTIYADGSRRMSPSALVVMSSVGLSVARIVTRRGSFDMGGATYDDTLAAHGFDTNTTESVAIDDVAAPIIEVLLADPALAGSPHFAFTPAQERELRQRGFVPGDPRGAAPTYRSDRWVIAAGLASFLVAPARIRSRPVAYRAWNDVREVIMR